MTTVYVVIGAHDCEGYSEPKFAFDTQEAADARGQEMKEEIRRDGYGYDYIHVIPLVLNQ